MKILYTFNIMGIPPDKYDQFHFFKKLFYSFMCFFSNYYCTQYVMPNLRDILFDPSNNLRDFNTR